VCFTKWQVQGFFRLVLWEELNALIHIFKAGGEKQYGLLGEVGKAFDAISRCRKVNA
jgi:hypothetical protein